MYQKFYDNHKGAGKKMSISVKSLFVFTFWKENQSILTTISRIFAIFSVKFFKFLGVLATQITSVSVVAEFILLLQLTSLPSCGG